MLRFWRWILAGCMVFWLVPGLALAQDQDPVAIAQQVVDNLLAGDFEAAIARFDATVAAQLTAPALAQTWQQIEAQVGAFEVQRDVQTQVIEEYTVVVFVMQFERAVLDFELSVDPQEQIGGFYIRLHQDAPTPPAYEAPEYADPALFEERDIVLNAGTDWELPGTLTLPTGEGLFPAVVLVHGSGAHDRDETYEQRKPFKDIAWGLASRGIAVLRYDKRTLVHGQRMVAAGQLTVQEETIDDALAAVALLRTTGEIDPAQIVIVGHSLGGYLAPRIASQSDAVAGLVIMAGNTRPLEVLMIEQLTYLSGLTGEITPEQQAQLDALLREAEAVKTLDASGEGAPEMLLGVPVAYWLDLRTYNPAATAQDITVPILILQGERDYQVTMADFEGWRSALADRHDVTWITYPALNHLFAAGEGAPSPAEYAEPGYVAEAVIHDIADWVLSLKS